MGKPAVCIVVPVLNTRRYLIECLDSLAVQTLSDIEMICVDNGSQDGSYELLADYAAHEPRMVVLRHAQGRQGGARNAGLQRARGAFIGFVDSDDFVRPTMFQRLLEAATGSNADVAVCNLSLCSHEGQPLRGHIPPADLRAGPPCTVIERPRLLRNLTICNRLFSRTFLDNERIRFPEGHYHEDQTFVIAALLMSRRIVTVEDSLYCYRRSRPGSVNETRGPDALGVFDAMDAVSTFMDGRETVPSIGALLDEVKVLKYLQLYGHTDASCQRAYFARMQKEFRSFDIPVESRLLSSSERREYRIARDLRSPAYAAYLRVRRLYGRARGVLGI